jgi:hypothetical protein
MQLKVDRELKIAHVGGLAVQDAVQLGIGLAPYNDDFIQNGWLFKFYGRSDMGGFTTINQHIEDVYTAEKLVEEILRPSCYHDCCCNRS